MAHPPLTEEEKAEITRLWLEGATVRKVTRGHHARLRSMQRPALTEEDRAEITRLRLEGASVREVMLRFYCSVRGIEALGTPEYRETVEAVQSHASLTKGG